jgi:hypothetical protein
MPSEIIAGIMNLNSLRDKLLAAARANPPADQVPHAFEKRTLAHLRTQPAPDLGALWTRMLWRAAAPCVAIALTISAWSFVSGQAGAIPTETAEAAEFAPDFEQTMLAVVEEQAEEFW